jgi:acetyl esterase/lipase
MRENAASLSASVDKTIIMGGSSGGNLAGAVALSVEANQKACGLIMACANTIYPTVIPEEYKSYWHPEQTLDSAMVSRDAMMQFLGTYLPEG